MWRYEIKFALTDIELATFERWLMAQPHFRRTYPERLVSSYYMDTPRLFTASDNLSGIADRTKYRLRWYGADDQGRSRFEIKIKSGRLGRKVSASLPVGGREFLALTHQEQESLLWAQESLRPELPADEPLRPVLLVSYRRNYFARPGDVRVTIDHDLEFGELWSGHEASAEDRVPYERNVIEFKFSPAEKDLVASILMDLPFYPVRNSKYMLGLSSFGRSVYI